MGGAGLLFVSGGKTAGAWDDGKREMSITTNPGANPSRLSPSSAVKVYQGFCCAAVEVLPGLLVAAEYPADSAQKLPNVPVLYPVLLGLQRCKGRQCLYWCCCMLVLTTSSFPAGQWTSVTFLGRLKGAHQTYLHPVSQWLVFGASVVVAPSQVVSLVFDAVGKSCWDP